jgi:membrane-associated phospholipid phosphatase
MLAVGFGVVAWLVVAGKLQWLDEYAVDHWMPGFAPTPSASGIELRGVWRPFPLDATPLQKALDLWTYPGSVLVSGIVVAAAYVAFRRRGHARLGAIWVAAWLAANAVEYVGKRVLDRPALHWMHDGVRVAIPSFHSSFPSGHTIRALFVAVLVAVFWRRLRWGALVWFLLALAFLVVAADHTPSDVLGGLLIGSALVLVVRAVPA